MQKQYREVTRSISSRCCPTVCLTYLAKLTTAGVIGSGGGVRRARRQTSLEDWWEMSHCVFTDTALSSLLFTAGGSGRGHVGQTCWWAKRTEKILCYTIECQLHGANHPIGLVMLYSCKMIFLFFMSDEPKKPWLCNAGLHFGFSEQLEGQKGHGTEPFYSSCSNTGCLETAMPH